MTHFTTHPHRHENKEKDTSWSFHNDQERKYIPQSCYATPLFLNFTDPSIGPHSWYANKMCVKGEKCKPKPHLQNNQKIPKHIYNYVFYPKVQYCNKHKTHKYLHIWIRLCAANLKCIVCNIFKNKSIIYKHK